MGRGPGVWQRRILETLDRMTDEQVCYVKDLVGWSVGEPSRSDHVAARRATKRLSEMGKVRAGLFRHVDEGGRHRDALAFTRPESRVESNFYAGHDLTPDWYSTIPSKYVETLAAYRLAKTSQ